MYPPPVGRNGMPFYTSLIVKGIYIASLHIYGVLYVTSLYIRLIGEIILIPEARYKLPILVSQVQLALELIFLSFIIAHGTFFRWFLRYLYLR